MERKNKPEFLQHVIKESFYTVAKLYEQLVKRLGITTEWVLDVEYKIAASSSCS